MKTKSKNFNSIILSLILITSLMVALVGCGKKNDSSTSSFNFTQEEAENNFNNIENYNIQFTIENGQVASALSSVSDYKIYNFAKGSEFAYAYSETQKENTDSLTVYNQLGQAYKFTNPNYSLYSLTKLYNSSNRWRWNQTKADVDATNLSSLLSTYNQLQSDLKTFLLSFYSEDISTYTKISSEDIASRTCSLYQYSETNSSTNQKSLVKSFWIDDETGLCLKRKQTSSNVGGTIQVYLTTINTFSTEAQTTPTELY